MPGEGSFGTLRCIQSLSVFVERRTASSSSENGKQFGTQYVFAVNRCFPEAKKKQLARVSRQSYTARGCENYEGRTDGKKLHRIRSEMSSTIWSRKDPLLFLCPNS